MTRKRRAALPRVPIGIGREERAFMTAVKEALEVSMGDRGDRLDSNPTWRDLTDGGLADLSYTITLPSYDIPTFPDVLDDRYGNDSIPPAPTGVAVSTTINNVYVTWTDPELIWVEYAEIYHAEVGLGDPAPVLADASFISTALALGQIYQFSTDPVTRHYFWVRFISYAGKVGPWHDIAGIEALTQQDPGTYLDLLEGELNENSLVQSLRDRIDLIDDPSTGLVGQLAAEITDRINGDNAVAASVTALEFDVSGNTSAVSAIANRIDAVGGSLDDLEAFYASFTSIETAVNDGVTGLGATYNAGVLLEGRVNNVNGFGTSLESFANNFEVLQARVDDGNTGLAATYSETTQLNGRLNNLAGTGTTVEALKTEVLSAVAEVPGANNLVAAIETHQIAIAGLEAQWTVKTQVNDLVGGIGLYNDGNTVSFVATVDTFAILSPDLGSEARPFVYDAGNVVMDGAYIQNLTVTNAAIANAAIDTLKLGDLAVTNAKIADLDVGKITGNTGNFVISNIGVADITTAMIDTAAITNAKIATAAVDTLEVADNAITVPQITLIPDGGVGDSWKLLDTITFNHGHSQNVLTFFDYAAVVRDDLLAGQYCKAQLQMAIDGVIHNSREIEVGYLNQMHTYGYIRIVELADLTPGNHTITLSVRGRDGNANGDINYYETTLHVYAAKR